MEAGDAVDPATGGWFGSGMSRTVTVVSRAADVIGGLQPVTRSENFKVAPAGPTAGAVNIGLFTVALLSVTLGPAVCVQAKDVASFDGCPFSCTRSVSFTIWLAGAIFASGEQGGGAANALALAKATSTAAARRPVRR